MAGVMNSFDQDQASTGGSRPGIVAAAVLRAACSSARMSEAFIARASGVSKDTIRSWAEGTCALASVAVSQLERLEAALLTAGAEPAHDTYRRQLRELGIEPVIARRGTARGSGLGVHRWVVEATLALLHWFRRLRIRWETRDDIHQAFLTSAAPSSAGDASEPRAFRSPCQAGRKPAQHEAR